MNALIRQAIRRPGTSYAFIARTFGQAADIAWHKVIKPTLQPLAAEGQVRFNESDLRVVFSNGSDLKLYGSEPAHADKLRGLHLDGVVFDEYGLIPPFVWEQIVSPTLTRKRGGAIFIGTPMGRNHFHSLYKHAQSRPDWFATVIRADESGVLSDEALELQRQIQTPEQYAQEYECSWDTAIHGAYYARELSAARAGGRIGRVPWEPIVEVETWWDLGHTDATAIVFTQQVGREVRVIDYVEDSRKDLAFYVKAVRERPYVYRKHHLPHDARAETLAGGGRSIERQLHDLHLRPTQAHPANDVLDGINQARLLFARCWFDEARCERLLDALAFYHAKEDVKHQTEKPEPEHDWSSHGADAFRYMAAGLRTYTDEAQRKPFHARTAFNPVTHGFAPRHRPGVIVRRTIPW